MGDLLWNATEWGLVQDVRRLLLDDPNIDVNWRNDSGGNSRAALHTACENGHEGVAALLLTHPNIDVNQRDRDGVTPFLLACFYGKTGCLRLLLNDHRVRVNEADGDGHTPLFWAAYFGPPETIRWMIASGRTLELGEEGTPGDAIEAARESWNEVSRVQLSVLLRRFRENPDQVRHEVKLELGCFDELAAGLFAVIVFLCDGLLELMACEGEAEEEEEEELGGGLEDYRRLFRIARQLPLELQMILCRRMVGSMRNTIAGRDIEPALRDLVKKIYQGELAGNAPVC